MTSYSLLVTRCRSHTYLHTHEYRVHARMYIAPLTSKYIRFGRSHLTVFSPPCYPSFLETPLLFILHCYYQESGPIHVLLRVQGDLGALEYGGSLTGHRSSFVFRTPYCYPNTLSIYNNTTDYIPYRVYRVALWYYGESRNTGTVYQYISPSESV